MFERPEPLLFGACARHSINRFISSSTAVVYGMADQASVAENDLLASINANGASKMMGARMIVSWKKMG